MAVNHEVHKLESTGNRQDINSLPLAYYESSQEDEINLLDLWCVLVKRKVLLGAIMFLCVLLGLGYAMTRPQLFDFYTVIEIGSRVEGQKLVNIEQPASVLDKINSAYIPIVIAKYVEQNPVTTSVPDISATLGKGGSIINLNIKGQDDNQIIYYNLLSQITENIKNDHQRMFSVQRNELELSRNRVNNNLQQLKEQVAQLKIQKERITEKSKLLEMRIVNTKKLMVESNKSKQQALKNTNSEGKALTFMMLENDLRQANDLLADLEEELHINLDNQRDNLDSQIAQNLREQSEQLDQLAKNQIQLDNLLETRALIQPMKSFQSVGKSKKIIVIMSIVIGLFIALFVVFFTEFLDKARRYSAEKNQSA